MDIPRFRMAVAVCDDAIYCAGGTCYYGILRTVQRLRNGQWTTLPPLPTGRNGASAAVLNHNLYMIGGEDFFGSTLNSVLILNLLGEPSTAELTKDDDTGSSSRITTAHTSKSSLNHVNKWQEGPALNTARASAAVAVLGASIYVAGGSGAGRGGAICSVERLNHGTQWREQRRSWIHMPPLTTARDAANAVALGEKLYVIGGIGGPPSVDPLSHVPLNSVEVFNPATLRWSHSSGESASVTDDSEDAVKDAAPRMMGEPRFAAASVAMHFAVRV